MSEISDVILELTGERPYQTIGSELRYRCFFCNNPKRKFYISSKTGKWVCYNEEIDGTLSSLVGRLTGRNYAQSKAWLKEHQFDNPQIVEVEQHSPNNLFEQITDLEANSLGNKMPSIYDLSMPKIPSNCKYLMDNYNNPEAYPYFDYCYKRKLSLEDIKKAHISYVTHGTFIKADGGKGYLSNSIVFFTYDKLDRPIYWNTRNIYDGIPKSLNASAQYGQISRKEAVFNLNNYSPTQDIAIAEGVFNALTINNEYILGVATFGKNVSNQQIAEIAHTIAPNHTIYICLDSDAFGMADKIRKQLLTYGASPHQVKIVDDRQLGKKDWNDIGRFKSNKLIHAKSFSPTLLSQVKKLI